MKNRKKAVPINTEIARAEVAAAMCVLMETGMREFEAAREVARHIRGSAVLQTVGRRGFPHVRDRPRPGESAARGARPSDRPRLLRGLTRQTRAGST